MGSVGMLDTRRRSFFRSDPSGNPRRRAGLGLPGTTQDFSSDCSMGLPPPKLCAAKGVPSLVFFPSRGARPSPQSAAREKSRRTDETSDLACCFYYFAKGAVDDRKG